MWGRGSGRWTAGTSGLLAICACAELSGLTDFEPQGESGTAGGGATSNGPGGGDGGAPVGGAGGTGLGGAGGEGGRSTGTAGGGAGGGDGGAGGAGPLTCDFGDGFDDQVLGPLWTVMTPPNISVGEDGDLVFGVPGGDGLQAAFVQTEIFDATQCEVVVELVEDMTPAGTFTHFELYIDSENRVGFLVLGNELRLAHELASSKSNVPLPLDATPHQFLKIAHGPMGYQWSTSADGVAWQLHRTLDSALPASSMRVVMGTEILPSTVGAPAYEARFDDVAAQPP